MVGIGRWECSTCYTYFLVESLGAGYVPRNSDCTIEGPPNDPEYDYSIHGRSVLGVGRILPPLISFIADPRSYTSSRFALGHGLGSLASETDLGIGCRGLEGVGTPYNLPRSRTRTHSGAPSSQSFDPSASTNSAFTSYSPIFVGPEGERVGEACACWLAKWGSDILGVEEWISEGGNAEEFDVVPPILSAHPELKTPELRVWSSLPGGMSSSWIRGVISSDAFFLGSTCSSGSTKGDVHDSRAGGEFERYLFAKRVVELRRKEKLRIKECNSRKKGKGVMPNSDDENSDVEASDRITDEDVTLSDDGSSKCSDSKRTECQAFGGISGHSSVDEEELDEEEYIELFSSGIHYSHLVRILHLAGDTIGSDISSCRPSSNSSLLLEIYLPLPAPSTYPRLSFIEPFGNLRTLHPKSLSPHHYFPLYLTPRTRQDRSELLNLI